MNRMLALPVLGVLAVAGAGTWYLRHDATPPHFTGFVEGEERVIRSEVAGRVVEVLFAEGDAVPANAVIARLDDADIRARLASKQEELAVLDAELATQSERVALVDSTWQRDVRARTAELEQARSAEDLAQRELVRAEALIKQGISTAQEIDSARARRDQARSGRERTEEMLARAHAEERTIALARTELQTLTRRHAWLQAQLNELTVTREKFTIRAPAVATAVQTQFIWPGELAQPGTAILSVLDPNDKYVQLYVPVADVGALTLGQRVAIELDSRPGERAPGEISFIADRAHFTPEKIETRSDRMGQVYRVKVRILEGVERFQPGTEGNVYLVSGES
jgi:HlyD family secretion protein